MKEIGVSLYVILMKVCILWWLKANILCNHITVILIRHTKQALYIPSFISEQSSKQNSQCQTSGDDNWDWYVSLFSKLQSFGIKWFAQFPRTPIWLYRPQTGVCSWIKLFCFIWISTDQKLSGAFFLSSKKTCKIQMLIIEAPLLKLWLWYYRHWSSFLKPRHWYIHLMSNTSHQKDRYKSK